MIQNFNLIGFLVQKRMASSHGSQCGFCTPGFVMSMYTLLRNNSTVSKEQIEESLDGNLCRCTGYRPILDAFYTFSTDSNTNQICCKKNESSSSDSVKSLPNICPSTGKACSCNSSPSSNSENDSANENENENENSKKKIRLYPQDSEPIFPPELHKHQLRSLLFQNSQTSWYRPLTLNELLTLKAKFPEARLIVGNSELGIEKKFKDLKVPIIIAVTHIDELNSIEWKEDGLEIGTSVTVSDFNKHVRNRLNASPHSSKFRVLEAYLQQTHWFAGTQIRVKFNF